jgi:hypothetical protein
MSTSHSLALVQPHTDCVAGQSPSRDGDAPEQLAASTAASVTTPSTSTDTDTHDTLRER